MMTINTHVPDQDEQHPFEDLDLTGNEVPDDLLESVAGGMLVSDPKRPPTYVGDAPGCWDPVEIPF